MTTKIEPGAGSAEVWIPLNKLKKSPHNARRTPHGEAALEALAASIEAKSMLQNLVVEPERDAKGKETGNYYVTAGEGRRLAQQLRVKRRQITKTEPIRCVVDATNDPLEVSLDENVTRSEMHPADQFDAFQQLSEERGWGTEEIAARFGVTANVVRQRLRLAAVSPRLMQLYRDGELALDQLMAFAITEDHARQEQVYDNLGWNREPRSIRYYMMETHVPPHDRRAIFVGVEAYAEAGGVVVRDLFSDEDGGYFEDAALLDRLALERLHAVADDVQGEGWKWAEAHLDFPYDHGLRRVYPQRIELPAKAQKRLDALRTEYDNLIEEHEGDADIPDDVDARLEELEAEVDRLSEAQFAFDADVMARAGVHVALDRDGAPRIERGFVRPADDAQPERSADSGRTREEEQSMARAGGAAEDGADVGDEEVQAGRGRISDALVRDLTAHRTLGLRLALGEEPDVALIAVTHALASQTFYHLYDEVTCLEIRRTSTSLGGYADGIEDTEAAQALAARHEGWAVRMPREPEGLWDFVATLGADERTSLLAHCAALTVLAVQQRSDTRRGVIEAADRLAQAVSLDMSAHWSPTVRSYLDRVSKVGVTQAVREGISDEAAQRIASMKKQPMAAAAEQLLEATGWLPESLRTSPSRTEAENADIKAA